MRRWTVLLALLVLLAPLFTACEADISQVDLPDWVPWGDKEVTSEPECPIVIGVVASRSGSLGAPGEELVLGYEMAKDDINREGGIYIGGVTCTLELVIEDDQSLPEEAQRAVKKLVEEHHVWVIIGAYSSAATIAAAGVASVYQIPFVVPTASSDLITQQENEWVFRINAPSAQYASTALDFVLEELGSQATLAIVYEGTLFGESAAVAAATGALQRGIHVVAYESFKQGSESYKDLLRRVQEAHPDVVYFAANQTADAARLLQQCQELGLNPQLYLGHAGAFVVPTFANPPEEVKTDPAKAYDPEYVIATAQWAVDANWEDEAGQSAAGFVERFTQWCTITYTQRVTETPDCIPGMRAAQAYTTLRYVVRNALERTGADGSVDWKDHSRVCLAIRDALRETNLQKTIFGSIRFDHTGQNSHQVLLVQIIDGGFVTVYPEAYAPQEYTPVPRWQNR